MFFDIEHSMCLTYQGLSPLALLDYPAVDVFDLINGMIDYNLRQKEEERNKNRRPAGDDWF